MSKNDKKYLIIVGILLVVYNVLVWAIPFKKIDTATFVISYVASMVAILVQPIIYSFALHNKETIKSKLYGWPILKVGYIYLALQMVITVLFYVLGAFIDMPSWISVIISVVVLSFAAVGIILTDTHRDEIEKMETNAPITRKFVQDLKNDAESFAKKITIEPIHSSLVSFADLVKYSDPVSNDTLIEIEDEIGRKYIEIKELIINDKLIEAKVQLDELYVLMEERNNRCKSSKR